MKFVCIVIGFSLLVVAGIYFVTPADSLPAFFPGHQTGVARVHLKHGLIAGAVGVVLMLAGWRTGRA